MIEAVPVEDLIRNYEEELDLLNRYFHPSLEPIYRRLAYMIHREEDRQELWNKIVTGEKI